MKKFEEELLEWTVFYVKNKDIMTKKIKDYKILKNYVEFEYKDGRKHVYYAYPLLKNECLIVGKDGWNSFVCLNNPNNLNFLIDNWKKFVSNPKLSIIFVHPSTNQRWVVFPYTHNKITDEESLKIGLKSLFESVPNV